MTDHHIHPEPAVRALVERAKAEAWDEGYEVGYDDAIFEQRGLPTDSDAHEFPHANPYRADSLAAQPATEAATVEEVGKVVWDTSRADEGTISFAGANIVARALLDTFDVRRKP